MQKYIRRYEQIILDVLYAIIARYERDPDYHFIDTKLDIATGLDFYPVASPRQAFKDKSTIYCWIQGRGLEALAEHAVWLRESAILSAVASEDLIRRIRLLIVEVMASMEKCRSRNHGRMFFCMTPTGELRQALNGCELAPLDSLPEGANFSDLFYSKGLLTAAAFLGDSAKLSEAENYFEQVIEDIRQGRFRTDQQTFDPKNPVSFVPGKKLQGPFMIALSGAAAAAKHCNRDKWLEIAGELIEHIISRHVNTGQHHELQKHDFWEAVDERDQPWRDDNRLICDPGHALEFTGLAMKSLLMMPKNDFVCSRMAICSDILKHNFELGFAAGPGGIIKSFDLIRHEALNTDMPWWSLPETIRAAAEIYAFNGDVAMLAIIRQCSEAFFQRYLNPRVHNMAYQTRNAEGNVAAVIPATPDADPGYHTGLSLIDALKILA